MINVALEELRFVQSETTFSESVLESASLSPVFFASKCVR
jgi:hypothetical protein